MGVGNVDVKVVWMHVAEDIYQLSDFCEHDDVHFGSIGGKFDRLSDS